MIDPTLLGPPGQSGGAQIQPQPEQPGQPGDGAPKAIYATLSPATPGTEWIAQNLQELGKAGLSLSKSDKFVVVFKPDVISAQTVKAAADSGKIDEIAVPADSLIGGKGGPAAAPEGNPPAEAGPAPQPQSTPAPGVQPTPARTQGKLAGLRLKGLMNGEPPSDRPLPGAGSVLNGLIKRAS